MTSRFTRRIEELEERSGTGKDVIVFWSGPQDDEKVRAAEREAERTGRPLLIIRWKDVDEAEATH